MSSASVPSQPLPRLESAERPPSMSSKSADSHQESAASSAASSQVTTILLTTLRQELLRKDNYIQHLQAELQRLSKEQDRYEQKRREAAEEKTYLSCPSCKTCVVYHSSAKCLRLSQGDVGHLLNREKSMSILEIMDDDDDGDNGSNNDEDNKNDNDSDNSNERSNDNDNGAAPAIPAMSATKHVEDDEVPHGTEEPAVSDIHDDNECDEELKDHSADDEAVPTRSTRCHNASSGDLQPPLILNTNNSSSHANRASESSAEAAQETQNVNGNNIDNARVSADAEAPMPLPPTTTLSQLRMSSVPRKSDVSAEHRRSSGSQQDAFPVGTTLVGATINVDETRLPTRAISGVTWRSSSRSLQPQQLQHPTGSENKQEQSPFPATAQLPNTMSVVQSYLPARLLVPQPSISQFEAAEPLRSSGPTSRASSVYRKTSNSSTASAAVNPMVDGPAETKRHLFVPPAPLETPVMNSACSDSCQKQGVNIRVEPRPVQPEQNNDKTECAIKRPSNNRSVSEGDMPLVASPEESPPGSPSPNGAARVEIALDGSEHFAPHAAVDGSFQTTNETGRHTSHQRNMSNSSDGNNSRGIPVHDSNNTDLPAELQNVGTRRNGDNNDDEANGNSSDHQSDRNVANILADTAAGRRLKVPSGRIINSPREISLIKFERAQHVSSSINNSQHTRDVEAHAHQGSSPTNPSEAVPRQGRLYAVDSDKPAAVQMVYPSATLATNGTKEEVNDMPIEDSEGRHGLYTGTLCGSSRLPNGYGILIYNLNQQFVGQSATRRRRDSRKLSLKLYSGNWKQGEWHGQGTLTFQNGDRYEGEFRSGTQHGLGTCHFQDGRIFEGRYDDGAMKEGTMWFTDGTKYVGLFSDRKRSGFGTYFFDDRGTTYYEGQWKNDQFDGRGRMQWSDGGYYNGEWTNGQMHGIGTHFNSDGSVEHRGRWSHGLPVVERSETNDVRYG